MVQIRMRNLSNPRVLQKYKQAIKTSRQQGAHEIKDAAFIPLVSLPYSQKESGFSLIYSTSHHYTRASGLEVQDSQRVPLQSYRKSLWAARTDPLWTGFSSLNFGTGKRNMGIGKTIRSWLTRRLRIAYKVAMEKEGYSTDGTRLEKEGEVVVEDYGVGVGGQREVFGTIGFIAKPLLMTMNPEELQRQMDTAVRCAINKSHGSRNPPRNNDIDRNKLDWKSRKPKDKPKPSSITIGKMK